MRAVCMWRRGRAGRGTYDLAAGAGVGGASSIGVGSGAFGSSRGSMRNGRGPSLCVALAHRYLTQPDGGGEARTL